MVSFSVTFSNILLMLLYLLPGFFMCKVKKIRPEHLSSVSVILLYICGFGLYVNALYRLDQVSVSASGGKADLGPLPSTSVALITTLAVIWALILAYLLFSRIRKKNTP